MRGATIRTAIWFEPAWRDLSPDAQLYALTCRALSYTGKVTDEAVSGITGWDASFRVEARGEVERSSFAHLLSNKRRPLSGRIRRAVFARDGRTCAWCGATERLQIDHRHPVALGGTDELSNLQVLCQPCNLRKGARVGVVQS